MPRWKMSDIKSLNIHINEAGVGKVLIPAKKKQITDADIQKAISKAQRKVQRGSQGTENVQGESL